MSLQPDKPARAAFSGGRRPGRRDPTEPLLPRLDGQVAIVTGASQGMGKEIARSLARQGARVLVLARDPVRTAAAAAEIRATSGNPAVESHVVDLSSLAAARSFAAQFSSRHSVLDILVNNAGGHYQRRRESVDGIELSWAINYFSPFLLTNLLLEKIAASRAGRIVNVASNAMAKSLTLADLNRDEKFDSWRAYGEAKLSTVMFTYSLARQLAATAVTVNALHPGLVATSVADSAAPEWLPSFVVSLAKLFLLTPEQGARTALLLAAAAETAQLTGKYFNRGREAHSTPISYDAAAQARAWQLGEKMTA